MINDKKNSVEYYMREAFKLAKKVKGKTSPNPAVGAVVVNSGNVMVGQGATLPPPGKHAEVVALDKAGDKALGSTLYVTLEPCCHYGKTPPCTEKIINSGIKKVVIAMLDPNPLVSGKGVEALIKAGISVEMLNKMESVNKLNEDFSFWIRNNIPFVTLKYAMTVDGKIADYKGSSKWITSERARKDVHRIRSINDAILVGADTVLKDNPTLNARIKNRNKSLLRVILDSKGRITEEYKVLSDNIPTLFAVKKNCSNDFIDIVKQHNKEIWFDDDLSNEKINVLNLLKYLGEEKNIVSLIVEGGNKVLTNFFEKKLFNKILVYMSSKILASKNALNPFASEQDTNMNEIYELKKVSYKIFKDNIRIEGYNKSFGV